MRVTNFKPHRTELKKRQLEEDEIVLTTIKNLGGKIKMPVMKFRKFIPLEMRETQIKKSLNRLTQQGKLIQLGDRCDSGGHSYLVVS